MRKIFFILFITASMATFAQEDPVSEKEVAKFFFTATAKGNPDGVKTEKIIGKDGGTLSSSDGKVEIIIPAAVLLQNTNISIQPVTPMAQGAIGKGYDLEPSGIQFKKQVTFIYHYSIEETEESSPELMGIAFRNNEGFWRQINSVVTDTIAKTIIGKISHFSEWGTEWKIFFQARDKRVKAGKQTKVYLCIAPKDEKNPDEKDVSNAADELFGPNTSTKFYVNNVLHGNNTEGFMAREKNFNQVYQAPKIVPHKNPVTLKVEIYDQLYYRYHGSYMTRTCKVQIYDNGYEVKMVANIVGGSSDAWGGIVINKDEGSFVVSMEKDKPEVINIKNNLERLINNCDKTILNPT
ncbi:MAG: hypothetical protein ABIW34_05845, partial [Ginsengibacter sp.]